MHRDQYAISSLLLIILLASSSAADVEPKECSSEISLISPGIFSHESLAALPASFLLKRLFLTADILIDNNELQLLMNLTEGSIIHKHELVSSFQKIQKKQKFDRALIAWRYMDDGYELSIHFYALWTLAKVYIEGTTIGKDRYRQYYQGEQGEPFDAVKHKHNIDNIIKMLKSEGYLAPGVIDDIVYNKGTKSVTVKLVLEAGEQFIIDDVVVTLAAQTPYEESALALLRGKLQKMMRGELCNSRYRQTLLDESARRLKRLLLRKGYLDALIELEESLNKAQGKIRLLWTIKLNHKKAFEFIGNHFFSNEQLLEQFLLFGKSLALLPPSLLAEEIVSCYKKKGFWDVNISWREEPDCIFFCITEGNKACISDITIEGVTAFAVDQLIKYHFSSLLHSPMFDVDLVKQSLDKMMQAYIQQGFWDIAVLSHDYIPLEDGTYRLCIKIGENERRFLRKISLIGFDDLVDQGPFVLPLGMDHIPFDLYLLQEQRLWLTRYLQERGYLYATPVLELVSLQEGVEIQWKMGGMVQPVCFGPTIVLGSSSLPSSLILRELEYHEGDVWSKKKLDRSVQRLKSLGIFDTVSLFPDQLLEPEPTKTVLVRCFLDDPFELRTRIGAQIVGRNLTYQGGATYKVGASMVIKNPTNRADSFHVDMDFTRYRRDLAAYYQVPWIGTVPLKTELRIYSSSYDQPIVEGSEERLYRALHDGIFVELTKDLPHFQFAMNIGVEWMAIKGVSPQRALELHFEPRLVGTYIPYFFFEPTLFFDYLDDKVQPTYGSLTLLSVKSMFPFDISRAFFLKMLVEQSVFVPLPASMVLGMRLRLGHIVHDSFRLIMPPERFYLGGFHSLRGYDPDLAPPLSCFTDCNHVQHLIPIGGKSMFNGTVELRFPCIAPLWGALFTDFGFLVQDSWSTVNADHMLAASGFGLRYTTPFGPISFDIGWKWHKKSPLERSFAWFLTFGQAF